MLSPIIPGGNLDMELHWQDVLAIMDPEVCIDKNWNYEMSKPGFLKLNI